MATRGEFAGLDVDFSSDSGGLASTTLLRALLSYFVLKKSLSWGWAGSVSGAGVRRAGSAGEDPDLDQVVGEYPVSAPDLCSFDAIEVGAVPAVAAFEVADAPS